jgi:hypothetical protein
MSNLFVPYTSFSSFCFFILYIAEIIILVCCMYAALMNNGAPSHTMTGEMYTPRMPVNGNMHSSHSQNGILEDNKSGSSANDAWRRWSLDKSGFSDFQG